MPLEFLKLLVTTVVIERDDDGKIVGERISNPVPLYDSGELEQFLANIHTELTASNETNGKVVVG